MRIARNDPDATADMVDRKLPRLLAVAARMLGDRAEAEDVAQEAFLRIWQQAARWQAGTARFDTWLYRVALNLCSDRLRRRRETYVADVPDSADTGAAPDQALFDTERRRSVDAALAALPHRQREAIVLTYYQELSNIEAASAMDVSVDALESLLARARRNLAAFLKGDDDEH